MSSEFVAEPKPEGVASEPVVEREPIGPTSAQSSTEQIVNAPVIVAAFGKEYPIRQFSIGQVFQASAHIARMALVFQSWGEIQKLETYNERVAAVMETVAYYGESVVGLIAVATNESAEFVNKQDALEALDVLAALVDKNLPLFSPENIERVKSKFAGLQARISELGGASSTTS